MREEVRRVDVRPGGDRVDDPGGAVARGEVPSVAEVLERTRWELAALAGRLRAVEQERESWERRYAGMARERDREHRQVLKLQRSESYRLGRAVVSFVKDPVRSSPWLLRGVLRRLRAAPRRAAGRISSTVDTARPGTSTVGRAGAPSAGRYTAAGQARTATDVGSPGRDQQDAPARTLRRRPGATEEARRLPVHIYVAIGLDPDALRVLVRTVSQRVLIDADHRPVVVTDSPTFALLRHYGVLLEYLPDRLTWQRHRDDRTYDDVLAERLTQLFAEHGSVRTVIVDRRNPPGLADLLASHQA